MDNSNKKNFEIAKNNQLQELAALKAKLATILDGYKTMSKIKAALFGNTAAPLPEPNGNAQEVIVVIPFNKISFVDITNEQLGESYSKPITAILDKEKPESISVDFFFPIQNADKPKTLADKALVDKKNYCAVVYETSRDKSSARKRQLFPHKAEYSATKITVVIRNQKADDDAKRNEKISKEVKEAQDAAIAMWKGSVRAEINCSKMCFMKTALIALEILYKWEGEKETFAENVVHKSANFYFNWMITQVIPKLTGPYGLVAACIFDVASSLLYEALFKNYFDNIRDKKNATNKDAIYDLLVGIIHTSFEQDAINTFKIAEKEEAEIKKIQECKDIALLQSWKNAYEFRRITFESAKSEIQKRTTEQTIAQIVTELKATPVKLQPTPNPEVVIETNKSDLSFFLQDCFAKMGLNPQIVKTKYEKLLETIHESAKKDYGLSYVNEYILQLQAKTFTDNRTISFALNNHSILDTKKFSDFMLFSSPFPQRNKKDFVNRHVFRECVQNPNLAKMNLTVSFDMISFATNGRIEDIKVTALSWVLNIESHNVFVPNPLPDPIAGLPIELTAADSAENSYKNIKGSKTW